jgi:hypothetical protein
MPNSLSPDPTLRPTSVLSPRRRPARPAAWIGARQARVAGLLLLAALAGAGCSDQTAPTSPDADDAPVSGGAADAKRTTFISDLQLRTYVVYVHSSRAYVEVNYELTNPGGKTSGLHIEGGLRQGSVNVGSGYAMIGCGLGAGMIGHGTCRSTTLLEIPAAGLQYGPAQFTLTLSKLVNNVATGLDSRTVDVFIIPI